MKHYFSYETSIGTLFFVSEEGAIVQISTQLIDEGICEETPVIRTAYEQLTEYLKGGRKEFDFPINPRGTAFQKEVWKALGTIPYGETWSYKQLATAVGNPKGCRAVGMANNKNPILIAIPCHRVIGSNGQLTGYAAGLDKKETLLQLEKSNPEH